MLEPGSSCTFFSSIFLFGQSDFQVSKTIFDAREILLLELLLLFRSSCYFLELLLGSSIWWRELGETPSDNYPRGDRLGSFVALRKQHLGLRNHISLELAVSTTLAKKEAFLKIRKSSLCLLQIYSTRNIKIICKVTDTTGTHFFELHS